MNDSNPLVSVIVPIYNTEKYLRECIDSIVSQTYDNLEIILINDGSTDSSGTICDEYASGDDRIRVIHKTNQGRSAARNDGLKLMKGDHFIFVDADDVLIHDAVEILVKETGDDPDVVLARMMDFYPDKEMPYRPESGESKNISCDDLYERFLLDNMHGTADDIEIYNGPVARLYSAGCRGIRFAEDLSYAEDYLYSLMLFLECHKVRYTDKVVYRYRRFYDEENHFWDKFNTLSLEAADSRIRALQYVKENKNTIYQDFLLRSYYLLLDLYRNCYILKYFSSAERIADKLDLIKQDVRKSSSFKELKALSKAKLALSFISYRLYSAALEISKPKRKNADG